jgi:hypothetical protein
MPLQQHLHASHQYVQYMNRHVFQRISPYLPSSPWAPLLAMCRQTAQWLPDLRACHLHIISALNVTGGNLLRTIAVVIAELTRSSASVRAEAFEMYIEAPPHGMGLDATSLMPWWKSLPVELYSTIVHLVRLSWLLFMFAPVILTSPLALIYNVGRDEWMELLRHTLETAGAHACSFSSQELQRVVLGSSMCCVWQLLHNNRDSVYE